MTSPLQPEVSMRQPTILGFDPGRDKCGVAVMGIDRTLYWHQVVMAANVIESLQSLCESYPISLLVMGNQTTSEAWSQKLLDSMDPELRLLKVDERYSSLEARDRYWQMFPPQGLGRFLPQGLRSIRRPIDDIVAIILIERYLDQLVATAIADSDSP